MARRGRGKGRHRQQITKTLKAPETSVLDVPETGLNDRDSMALWICTPFGILMPAARPSHTYDASADDRALQVRCRERVYLDRFRELYCPELGESLHFDHDYPWKAYVTHEALAAAVGRMVLDIDATKFKPLTNGPKGLKGREESNLHSCYSAFWSTHLRLGDGTSSFDAGNFRRRVTGILPGRQSWDSWLTDNNRGGRAGGGVVTTTVNARERCAAYGHWFTGDRDTCKDCDAPKPQGQAVPAPGSVPVFPAGVVMPRAAVSYGLGRPQRAEEDDDFAALVADAVRVDAKNWPDDNFAPAGEGELLCDDCYVEITGNDAGCSPYCQLDEGHDGVCSDAEGVIHLTDIECTVCESTGHLTQVPETVVLCPECRVHGGSHNVSCARRRTCEECGTCGGNHRSDCILRDEPV